MSRRQHQDRLHGFWLGLSIGNWTGLVTEMDKIGGEGPAGRFYTRADWGQPDQPSIWGQGVPSALSPTIDWVLRGPAEVWGSDDDSDIEYIYLQLMLKSPSPLLTGAQIRQGWLRHIYTDRDTPHRNGEGQPENFLWVSNQQAFDLMAQGWLPPFTGLPPQNPHHDMIDAQLTTELFGALAPGRPDVARQLAYLPIHTTASGEAADIAQFYVALHASAAVLPATTVADRAALHQALLAMALQARGALPANQYPAKMFDFVLAQYRAGVPWEQARDALYQRYQVQQADGYEVTARRLYCNGCFAAGINFAASLLSYFYGEGDMRETLKIAVLAGWDSDNPAATWGGLYGLMLGPAGVTQQFGHPLSQRFDIHRTRKGFANRGQTDFGTMARQGVAVTDKVVAQLMQGRRSADGRCWWIPAAPRPPAPTP
ncbi:MAG: ADP-ribosylglycohydrolase family protein [Rubrivivax sp.]